MLILTCITLLTPGPAWAQDSFYVRQPEVEKGETEIEEHGVVSADPTTEENLRQSHEVEVTEGLTDRWQLMVEGLFEQPLHENLQATEVEVGTQFEMIKRKGDGFDLAFQKFSGCPQLMANWYSTRDKRIGEAQRVQFLTGAWKLANDKARELGWVV
jgi:hypothetical protein